jgi:hypothetical protein
MTRNRASCGCCTVPDCSPCNFTKDGSGNYVPYCLTFTNLTWNGYTDPFPTVHVPFTGPLLTQGNDYLGLPTEVFCISPFVYGAFNCIPGGSSPGYFTCPNYEAGPWPTGDWRLMLFFFCSSTTCITWVCFDGASSISCDADGITEIRLGARTSGFPVGSSPYFFGWDNAVLTRGACPAIDCPPPCNENTDCPPGYFCINGGCRPNSPPGMCDHEHPCPSGYTCLGGSCVLQPCDDTHPCPTGMECYFGLCVPSCSGVVCPFGVCKFGHCYAGCVDPVCPSCNDCVYDGTTQWCVPTPGCSNCTTSADCPPGQTCITTALGDHICSDSIEAANPLWKPSASQPNKVQVKPPTLKQAVLFGMTLANHALGGSKEVDETERKRRYELCLACDDHYDKQKDRCKLCGCHLAVKQRWLDSYCPINKW